MMSSKRTSKIAVLSILLTFTHSIGFANANSSVGLGTVYITSEVVKKPQKGSERKQAKKEPRARKGYLVPSSRTLSARAQKMKNSSRKESSGGCNEISANSTPRSVKLRRNKRAEQKAAKQGFSAFSNLTLKSLLPKLPSKQKTSIHEREKATSRFVNESQLSSARKRYCTPSSAAPSLFLETEIVRAPVERTKELQDNEIHIPVVQVQTNPKEQNTKTTKQLASQASIQQSEGTEQSLRELAQGASLPVLVRSNPEVSVQRQKEELLKELVAERRQCKRKSVRQALEARSLTKKVARGGSVTSTLRYDPEKAAEIKSRRNCKVSPEAREQKYSSCKRDARANGKQDKTTPSEDASQEEQQTGAGLVRKTPKSQVASNAQNFYRNSKNTNIDSYLTANQYSCSSEETDWPCSSCVSKRRTHNSISVCTMVVTVIAMIVGALIIANATESQTTSDPTPPTPTP
ncbi:sperm tail-specific-like protein [Chlamydia pneumoniae TW-183]|uniref:Sperm tail-specific-like protein n=2 Tax=Chlamydia pneumoniae TaxID=83558 RepID=Q9Z9B9_CHLPN|nr:hypothetical protein [Chlamydia pneumoniae]AAD18215.1 CT289 hypothetical protein [Chlamydia pneumoniae CWL029]AAF38521.1 conserved hypothetical protein [Chlamydia pneumoniae AR39]AAP97996.1 sperm tail-specific-like protein [Chlamydia pneumoniae TW-183]CRI32559.1 Sperm tail-specific-like protein [Chlamydia pneumoniae]CRI35418.1 Sperm tail-specific-like protein [Chlamydia pneumoniae]